MNNTPLLLQEGFTRANTPQNLILNQHPYLTNNWMHLLSHTHFQGGSHQMIKIEGGVVILNNGKVVIRCAMDLPDGWYQLGEGGSLFPAEPEMHYPWRVYPDTSILAPKYHRLNRTAPIDPGVIRLCLDYLNDIRACNDLSEEETDVFLSGDCFVEGNRSYRGGEPQNPPRSFSFGTLLPLQSGWRGDVFLASQLRVAMTEVLRYDKVAIYFDPTEIMGGKYPLIFGVDWNHCALVFPK